MCRLICAAVCLAMVSPAMAQNVVLMTNPATRAAPSERTRRVTLNFQLSVPVPPMASTVEWTKAIDGANQLLYGIVDRQCAVLAAALSGECRLTQLNVGSNINSRLAGGASMINATAGATFEIEVLPAPPPPPSQPPPPPPAPPP